jgi:hypothetical protein
MTLLTGFGGEEKIISVWLARYAARVPQPEQFALANRVLLLRSATGVGIDIAMGALPFEESAVRRAQKIELEPGAGVRICTAEDLIVMKAFASRDLDWHDLRGILVRQGTRRLDWNYIEKELRPLCELKEAPEIMERLEALRHTVAATEP